MLGAGHPPRAYQGATLYTINRLRGPPGSPNKLAWPDTCVAENGEEGQKREEKASKNLISIINNLLNIIKSLEEKKSNNLIVMTELGKVAPPK